MRIALGTFARAGIEARLGPDIAAGVNAALEHYARRTGSGRALVELPGFLRGRAPEASGAGLELTVDPEIGEALGREAQGLPPEQLVAHAVLVYLAELDRSGVEVLPAPVRS